MCVCVCVCVCVCDIILKTTGVGSGAPPLWVGPHSHVLFHQEVFTLPFGTKVFSAFIQKTSSFCSSRRVSSLFALREWSIGCTPVRDRVIWSVEMLGYIYVLLVENVGTVLVVD